MIAIQLALSMQLGTLCIQLGTLCIQLSHLYSAPKLLEKASFNLEPQYERSVLPRLFLRNSGGQGGGGGQVLWQGGVRDYLAFVFIAAPLVKR